MGGYSEDIANIITPPRRGAIIRITLDTTARAYDLRSMVFGRSAAPDPTVPNGDKVMLRIRAITADVHYYLASDDTVTLDSAAVIAAGGAMTLLGTFCDTIPAGQFEDVTISRDTDKYLHIKGSAAGTVVIRPSSMVG